MQYFWLFNGAPLSDANRFAHSLHFGMLTLLVRKVTPLDAGQYTLIARNALGETSRQANVSIVGKENVLTQTLHDAALPKINELENLNKFEREEVADFVAEVGESGDVRMRARAGWLADGRASGVSQDVGERTRDWTRRRSLKCSQPPLLSSLPPTQPSSLWLSQLDDPLRDTKISRAPSTRSRPPQ